MRTVELSKGERVPLEVIWLIGIVAFALGATVSLWAAFVFAVTVTMFVLYAWATK